VERPTAFDACKSGELEGCEIGQIVLARIAGRAAEVCDPRDEAEHRFIVPLQTQGARGEISFEDIHAAVARPVDGPESFECIRKELHGLSILDLLPDENIDGLSRSYRATVELYFEARPGDRYTLADLITGEAAARQAAIAQCTPRVPRPAKVIFKLSIAGETGVVQRSEFLRGSQALYDCAAPHFMKAKFPRIRKALVGTEVTLNLH
jgi:hypothetical protein